MDARELAGWRRLAADPAAAAVVLDFDGTLAPIVGRPQDARPAAGAREVLTRLAGRVAALAVLTGRPAPEVVELGGLDAVPGLIVLGHYGLQRWQDGRLSSPAEDPGVRALRPLLGAALAGADPGASVEDKRHSLAVHTRAARDPAAELARLTGPLTELARAHALEAVPGRYVLELRPPGVDKGTALTGLLAGVPARSLLLAGDDLGDLPAFAAARQAAARGLDVVVLAVAGPDADPRVAAAADAVLGDPGELVALLGELG